MGNYKPRVGKHLFACPPFAGVGVPFYPATLDPTPERASNHKTHVKIFATMLVRTILTLADIHKFLCLGIGLRQQI